MVARRSAPDPLGDMAKRLPPRTTFQSKLWVKVLSFSSFVLCTALAAYFKTTEGWSTWSVIAGLLSALTGFGFAQTLTQSVRLLDDSLVISTGFRKRQYSRESLDSVTWEAGSGVSVRFKSGSWLKMPELGHNSQSLCNSIRAWLQRTASG